MRTQIFKIIGINVGIYFMSYQILLIIEAWSRPANENADPLDTPASALDYLYHWKKELLKQDTAAMSLACRRQRQQTLAKFDHAEKLLLAEL